MHCETVDPSLSAPSKTLNEKGTWAQNRSSNSVLCCEERERFSLSFLQHFTLSFNHLQTQSLSKMCSRAETSCLERGFPPLWQQAPPCWKILERAFERTKNSPAFVLLPVLQLIWIHHGFLQESHHLHYWQQLTSSKPLFIIDRQPDVMSDFVFKLNIC